MNRGYYSVVFRLALLVIAISAIVFVFFPPAYASAVDMTDIMLIAPTPDTEIIAKRPEIVCRTAAFDAYENVMVLLDGVDVTGIILITPDGFSFRPVEILTPGNHVLTVVIIGEDGASTQRDFSFSTRHSGPFEEAGAQNNLSLAWEQTLKKPDDAVYQNHYKIESNLGHESIVKEQAWEMRFNTNLRYLDQNLAVYSPLDKGINLANYLFTGAYRGENIQADTEIGDVYVSETRNTVNLSRRGGTFSAEYQRLKLKTFAVKSEEVFGFTNGMGIGGSSDEHITGISGEIGLFSDNVKLKTIYASGGEKGDSYSIYTGGGNKKGNVLGFLLSSSFFDGKLNTEAEYDMSSYDADTADEFSYEKDNAGRLGVNGYWDDYSYGVAYERIGPDYQVIGNPYLQADREGATASFMANYPVQSAAFAFSSYRDNLDDIKLYARTNTNQCQFHYTFTKFSYLPIGVMYQRSDLQTTNEPEYMPRVKNTMDAVSATVNYTAEAWNFGLQAGYSDQDDKTPQNYDTDAVNCSVSSTYYSEYISVSPSASFNRSHYRLTGVHTDTKTATLDVRGAFWDRRITYECAGTFSRMESSDDTVKQDGYHTNFRVAYILAHDIWGLANPSMGFMGYYNTTEDYIYKSRSHDFTLLFVFSTSMPFSL